mgnify:CR=1 FL=1
MGTARTIAFTRGVPPSDAFPVDEVVECAEAALRQDPAVLLQYGRSAGYLPLRQWIAEANGRAVDDVLVSNGSLQILDFISMSLLNPGDTVFVEAPTYDRALTTFRRYRAQAVGIPLENDGVDLDAFEQALRSRRPRLFYVIADFQNPAGATTSAAKRRRLIELAEQHGFWIVEDAPYRDLRYYGEPQPPMASLSPPRVLQLSSFSKRISPGIRIGYLIAPPEVVSRLSKVAEDTYISPAMPTEGIVHEYCRRGYLERNIPRLRDLFRPKLDATLAALSRDLPEANWMRPEGGYFVGVNLPIDLPGKTLVAKAAEAGLALTDGDGFFPEKPAQTFVRIPFCGITVPEIEEGVARLAQVCRELIK